MDQFRLADFPFTSIMSARHLPITFSIIATIISPIVSNWVSFKNAPIEWTAVHLLDLTLCFGSPMARSAMRSNLCDLTYSHLYSRPLMIREAVFHRCFLVSFACHGMSRAIFNTPALQLPFLLRMFVQMLHVWEPYNRLDSTVIKKMLF